MAEKGLRVSRVHYLIGAYLIAYGTLVLLALLGVFPGPLTSGLTPGYLLWALGAGLIPLGIYYLLAVWRSRGRRESASRAVP